MIGIGGLAFVEISRRKRHDNGNHVVKSNPRAAAPSRAVLVVFTLLSAINALTMDNLQCGVRFSMININLFGYFGNFNGGEYFVLLGFAKNPSKVAWMELAESRFFVVYRLPHSALASCELTIKLPIQLLALSST